MARIRTIKPEFFRHSDLYEAERESGLPLRLAFAGLWTAADREGRFKWKPRELKLDCLPHDDVDFSRVLDALATRGWVVRYAVSGVEYGAIPTWQTHQIINNRESASTFPEPNENNMLTRAERVDDACPTPLEQVQGEGKGKEGEGKGRENTSPVAEATRGVSLKFEEFWKERPRRDGDDPRKPAEKKFNALVKTGVDPEMIISGAKLASAAARERGIYGTKFIPQTVKWLNDQRFVDYAAEAYNADEPKGIDWDAVLTSFKRFRVWSKHAGPDLDSPECRVPADMLVKYGLLKAQDHQVEIPHLKSMGGMN